MRCRFKQRDKSVIATTRYAGTLLQATATCDPSDTFDFEKGRELAEKRLEVKVASKRERYYTKLMNTTYTQLFEISKKLAKICKKRGDACDQLLAAQEALDDYLRSI